jgi:hypothetical protein
MFWNKKLAPDLLGVPLGELQPMLSSTSIKTSLQGNTLLARHEHYTIRVEVVPPRARESENGPIRAVVRLTTDLPRPVLLLFHGREPESTAAFNAFAALGSLYSDGRAIQVGSRLTIYEEEDSWRTLHLPLLLFTIVGGTEAILGAMRRTLTNEDPIGGASEWIQQDLEQVERFISRGCVCTTRRLGLTAEFGLDDSAVSAAFGDHRTALFQMMADQPHPELGGGLFCLLQMPHEVQDENHLKQICMRLNNLEMVEEDLPPHFGAWCPSRFGNHPSYISFLPNALHRAAGIAVNTAIWAINRASWANRVIAPLSERLQ